MGLCSRLAKCSNLAHQNTSCMHCVPSERISANRPEMCFVTVSTLLEFSTCDTACFSKINVTASVTCSIRFRIQSISHQRNIGHFIRAWRIMLIFLILCYASNAHLLNIYASRIYYYAQYYAHAVVAKITKKPQHLFLVDMWCSYQWPLLIWALTVTLPIEQQLMAHALNCVQPIGLP